MLRTSLSLVLAAAASAQQPGEYIVEADRIWVAPGTDLTGDEAKLAVRQGKIVAVGREIPQAMLQSFARVRPGAVVVPGFVSAHDQLGETRDLAEKIDAFTPALLAADAFDPFDEDLQRFAAGGVTAVGLAPASANTFGGIGAVVKWSPDGGRVVAEQTYAKLALVDEALDQERFPTSRMGAADLMRTEFAAARSPLAGGDEDLAVLHQILAGNRRAAIHVRSHAEILAALEVCEELGIAPLLIGGDEAEQSIARLREVGAGLVLGPVTLAAKAERLRLPAVLHAAKIPFSISAPDAASLRLSAALATHHGLPADAALAAITRVPAEQCGVAERVGSLRVGCDADFAAFDGDPLDLTSRLTATYIDGRRVDPAREETR